VLKIELLVKYFPKGSLYADLCCSSFQQTALSHCHFLRKVNTNMFLMFKLSGFSLTQFNWFFTWNRTLYFKLPFLQFSFLF